MAEETDESLTSQRHSTWAVALDRAAVADRR